MIINEVMSKDVCDSILGSLYMVHIAKPLSIIMSNDACVEPSCLDMMTIARTSHFCQNKVYFEWPKGKPYIRLYRRRCKPGDELDFWLETSESGSFTKRAHSVVPDYEANIMEICLLLLSQLTTPCTSESCLSTLCTRSKW